MVNHAKLAGFGSYVPSKILSNQDLEKIVDTSDEWIFERSGIRERRITDPKMSPSDMAIEAIKNLKSKFPEFEVSELDLIIVATTTPDFLMPNTACVIQEKIGNEKAACFDVLAACSGWLYSLSIGNQFLKSGTYSQALIIGCEALTRLVDWTDRTTCILFGDGCGVTWLKSGPGPGPGIVDVILGSYGNKKDLLMLPQGGYAEAESVNQGGIRKNKMVMKGKELFKVAVTAMSNSSLELLNKNNLTTNDIDWFLPHQANMRIMDAVAEKIGMDSNKIITHIEKYGNTSSACVPMMLSENFGSKIKSGDLILVSVFGGGVTFGSALIRV